MHIAFPSLGNSSKYCQTADLFLLRLEFYATSPALSGSNATLSLLDILSVDMFIKQHKKFYHLSTDHFL
jgi:hypothetical protein